MKNTFLNVKEEEDEEDGGSREGHISYFTWKCMEWQEEVF